jgi:hypothetical protein
MTICKIHYQRIWRNGTLENTRPTVEQRFWRKLSLGEGCWEWLAGLTMDGYGQFHPRRGFPTHAHRYSYDLLVGPIPDGLDVDHLCRNRKCVNPDHLEPVTVKVNILRGTSPTANNARKTHCKHGHEFSVENTYWRPTGGRTCITCRDLNKQRYAMAG